MAAVALTCEVMVTTVPLDRLKARVDTEGVCAAVGVCDDVWLPDVQPPKSKARARELARAAEAACSGCPVMRECLTWAVMTGQEHGTWGGRAEHEIALMRRDLVASVASVVAGAA